VCVCASGQFELRFHVPLVTKWVISERFFPASFLASTKETKSNSTKANIHPEHKNTTTKTGIERAEALADISRSALCCHSNEARAPIANPPNCAQLGGHFLLFHKLHSGPCSRVGMQRGTDTQTDTHKHRHTDGCVHSTFHVVYDSRENNVINTKLQPGLVASCETE